jgi:hypothetical protein
LNLFGVLTGAILLAVLGKWSLLGVGLIGMFFSSSVIGFALMPGTLINLAAFPFIGKRIWFLGFPFLVMGAIYSNVIVGVWCVGVVAFFVEKAGAGATVPALLWAYGVSISPLSYLTQRSGPDNSGFADILITMAAQIAVVVMAVDYLVYGLAPLDLIFLCGLVMFIAAFVQAVVSFLVMKDSAPRASVRDAPA